VKLAAFKITVEDGSNKFLWNVGAFIPDYKESGFKRQLLQICI